MRRREGLQDMHIYAQQAGLSVIRWQSFTDPSTAIGLPPETDSGYLIAGR